MADNTQTSNCIHRIGGAQLFMAPDWTADQKGVKVHIVDVFSLQIATGYDKNPVGRLLIASETSLSQGRVWSLAKACQLVRNDNNPNRWVILQRHKRAWGLFWAGGGLNQCREQLLKTSNSKLNTAIVPVTAEALLKLILTLEDPEDQKSPAIHSRRESKGQDKSSHASSNSVSIWKVVSLTSLLWIAVFVFAGFAYHDFTERQNKRLELLIEKVGSQ